MHQGDNHTSFRQGFLRPRSFYGKLGAWASIGLNLFLFLIKGLLGLITGSLALIADAVHTLSDLATSLIVLITFYITAKPSDEKHPFGHGRAEFISAIIMSTLLAITAFELFRKSIQRILDPSPFQVSWSIISVIILTAIFKMGLGFYSRRLAKKINSTALMADAWHHYLDAISTFLVVTAFIFSYFEYPQLDGPVGLLITLTIFYSAYKIAKTPIDHLLGTPPNEELLDRIEKISLNFPEVKGVHDVIIHNYGEFMIMSLHIEIEESLSFIEAHQISEQVDKTLTQQLGAYVTVHYDPVMERTPLYQDIERKIKRFCENSPHCDSFHDLRIYGHQNQIKLILDLVASASLKENDNKVLVKECEQFIKKSIPEIDKITIKVEPKFSISRKSRHH